MMVPLFFLLLLSSSKRIYSHFGHVDPGIWRALAALGVVVGATATLDAHASTFGIGTPWGVSCFLTIVAPAPGRGRSASASASACGCGCGCA